MIGACRARASPDRRPDILRIPARSSIGLLVLALVAVVCVGVLGRGFWTPDEPREADISWRMSWQPDKAVPLLAGEAFCEKPPLTYWIAGAAIHTFGAEAWVVRLPNLLYALMTALAVAAIGRRSLGTIAGFVAAAAITTFLLSYQVAIWLATDAPLLATVAVALLGLYRGFHAERPGERLLGYSAMHAALALGFLSKSAAAWMVPVLTIFTLIVWERRWRELLRWELYVGLALQAVLILSWVWFVYSGPDGAAHLRVFFWNNLAGRFAKVDAPAELQYAGAHRNTPGKYLIELPVYLFPWTLLVFAAARRAFLDRHAPPAARRPVQFALAAFVPTLAVLSVAATARNIYLAPALPGLALLLGWWAVEAGKTPDPWDVRALRATVLLLLLGIITSLAALLLVGWDSWFDMARPTIFVAIGGAGILASTVAAGSAWRAIGRRAVVRSLFAMLLAYCALLVGPVSQIYRGVDAWQNLAEVGRAIHRDVDGQRIILFAPDETTRAFVDMYAAASVDLIPGPIDATTTNRLVTRLALDPRGLVVTQLPGRSQSPRLRAMAASLGLARQPAPDGSAAELPEWVAHSRLHVAHRYTLPNGRRYALLEPEKPPGPLGP
jgi:4-amino-4-deoxy-L-arabinose transferase-like glycosyltransferase